VQRPGGDAAVVRVHGTKKALAITTDCTPRYCFADPVEGGKQAVAEVWRNLVAVGAKPLAITDCMNFGNPQRPEIMGQFVGCIEGMAAACKALDFPVVSGNVSLYNETNGVGILPTPAIGGVGVIADYDKQMTLAFAEAPHIRAIWLIGGENVSAGHLGQSLWLREIAGREDGPPPPVNLEMEKRAGQFVQELIEKNLVAAVHDVSDGGLLVALAEMALASNIGVSVDNGVVYETGSLAGMLFGEDQGRYVVVDHNHGDDTIRNLAVQRGVPCHYVGMTDSEAGGSVSVGDDGAPLAEVPLDQLRAAHQDALPKALKGEL
jgi:phosphoribosylformylglycinamidine synthase